MVRHTPVALRHTPIERLASLVLAVLIALAGAACTDDGAPTLDPGRIGRAEWDRVVLRIGGLAPHAYLVTGSDGLSVAPDLRVSIGGVDATPIDASGAGIDVRLTGPLALGFHDLDVRARGRDFHVANALEVFDDPLDGGERDGSPDANNVADAAIIDGGPRVLRVVAAGGSHSCATGTDSLLRCFGLNDWGQLGTAGFPAASSTPLPVIALGTVAAADAGLEHTCAITTDGGLWCWGRGSLGRLGLGETVDRLAPTHVGTARWRAIATGEAHSCGIEQDGSLWCWGANDEGQIGVGTTSAELSPRRIGTRTDWERVATGTSHSCAIRADGSLWCWGKNNDRQIGDGTNTRRTVPVAIAPGTSWNDVTCGDKHSCGIRGDGVALCWGAGSNGRLGTGATADAPSPVAVFGSTSWAIVSAGLDYNCGLAGDGVLWCWGKNGRGSLGLGDTADRTRPTMISFASTWNTVDAGTEHSCAFAADGSLYCWGRNRDGECGAPPRADITSPRMVALP